MSHTLTLFIILSITVVASPGPGVLLTVMTTLEEGGRKTPWCSGGLACGTFILAMIAVVQGHTLPHEDAAGHEPEKP